MADGDNDIVPMRVEVHGFGRCIVASTVEDLMEILWRLWPVAEGSAFLVALIVCQEAIDGEKPAGDAREAFLEAALEAGVTIAPDLSPPR